MIPAKLAAITDVPNGALHLTDYALNHIMVHATGFLAYLSQKSKKAAVVFRV